MEKELKFNQESYAAMKVRKEGYFKQIKDADEGLKQLRKMCDHPETELCTYSTRPGQYFDNTEICSICGEVVNWPQDNWRSKLKKDSESMNDGGFSTGLGGDQYEE